MAPPPEKTKMAEGSHVLVAMPPSRRTAQGAAPAAGMPPLQQGEQEGLILQPGELTQEVPEHPGSAAQAWQSERPQL